MKYDITDNYYFWDELAKCLNNGYSLLARRNKLLLLLDELDKVDSKNVEDKKSFISIVKNFIERYDVKIQLSETLHGQR